MIVTCKNKRKSINSFKIVKIQVQSYGISISTRLEVRIKDKNDCVSMLLKCFFCYRCYCRSLLSLSWLEKQLVLFHVLEKTVCSVEAWRHEKQFWKKGLCHLIGICILNVWRCSRSLISPISLHNRMMLNQLSQNVGAVRTDRHYLSTGLYKPALNTYYFIIIGGGAL